MKRVWRTLGAVSAAVTLVGAIRMGDDLDAWIALVGNLIAPLKEPIAEWLLAAWTAIFMVSLLVTFYIVMAVAFRIVLMWLSKVPVWLSWLKQVLAMTEVVDKSEALQIIQQSDFFQSRLPGSKERRMGGVVNALSNLGYGMQTERERMMERQFLRMMIRQFEDQRPNAVEDGQYMRDPLETWLDDLFDKEIENELGSIPRV